MTPSAVAPILKIVADTPLATWRDYLRFHAVRNNSNLLSRQIDEARFAFTGKVLQGQTAQKEPWKRAIATIADTDGLGEAVGRIYVARHFTPESKAAMEDLVANLRKALRMNIERPRLDGPGDQGRGLPQARHLPSEDRLPEQVARLLDGRRRAQRPRRQRHGDAQVLPGRHQQARGHRARPRGMGHDPADDQRVLQLIVQRDRVPGGDPATAVLRRRAPTRR